MILSFVCSPLPKKHKRKTAYYIGTGFRSPRARADARRVQKASVGGWLRGRGAVCAVE